MDMPVQMPGESLLLNSDIPFPTTLQEMQMFTNNISFEWDLANLWNGYYLPENYGSY
jgi:hypothetical protein